MNNALQPFAFEENLVRVHTDENGEPWFVAKDVCRVLDISDHHQAVGNLEDDEGGRYTIPTPSGDQQMLTVSESGLYALIFRSRKPEARRLLKWVTSEVSPPHQRPFGEVIGEFYQRRRKGGACYYYNLGLREEAA